MTEGDCRRRRGGLVEGEFELGGALLGVGDGGFVAVVAVGDDELFVGHGGEEEIDEVGVGELPEAVDDVVLVGDGEVGGLVSGPSFPEARGRWRRR